MQSSGRSVRQAFQLLPILIQQYLGQATATLSSPIADPATFVSGNSFVAKWKRVSGATGYRLDVATDNSFTNFVPGYQDRDVGNVLSAGVAGLSPETTYYYRVRAYAGNITSGNSNVISVRTFPATGLPLVVTNPATVITSRAARLNGSVNPHGFSTTVHFEYGTTDQLWIQNVRTGGQSWKHYQNVFDNIVGLSPGTTYHFRLVGTNQGHQIRQR